MPPPLPEYEEKSRREALDWALEVRRRRADLKRRLKSGDLSLEEVLERSRTDNIVGTTKVVDVLSALPGIGAVRARKLMETAGILPKRRMRGLGRRQRERLVASLELKNVPRNSHRPKEPTGTDQEA
jgi:hypothetical protein